jgi:predicted aldo/keto reductase-like oxidoreductase
MEIVNYRPAMRYRPFGSRTNVLVSALGMGAMRLPMRDGRIDDARAVELIEAALQGGVNYVDTAYVYNDGESERVVGLALDNGWRDKAYVATKLPVWNMERPGDQEAPFQTQLARLRAQRVDFYLLHALNRRHWKCALDSRSLEWLDEQKRRGRIRFAGFSFHDEFELFKEIVDAYDWDFCQIQYNYAQPDVQAGRRGLQYAAAKGIGVAVMEPLFGGFLSGPQLPPAASLLFEEAGVNPVSSALRWIWNQPEPSVVLSGMGDKNQLKDNLRTVESADVGLLSERERVVLEKVCRYIREHVPIGCSTCGYCLKSCPVGVKIPTLFDLYNKHLLVERRHTLQPALYRMMLPQEKASACVACGKCKLHCPQGLDIPAWLGKVAAEFEAAKG